MKSLMVSLLLLSSAVWMLVRSNAGLPESPRQLHIITYNAHLLPPFARSFAGERSDDNYRADQIGAAVSRYDLVGLCECFDPVTSDNLIAQARRNASKTVHVVQSSPVVPPNFVNGGLLLLTRHEVVTTHEHTYRHASRVLTSGFRSDGYAAKGVIHARLAIGSALFLDVFLTHLESKSRSARTKQIRELVEFVAMHSQQSVPFLVLGDLNVPADIAASFGRGINRDSEYAGLLNQFRDVHRPVTDSWTAAGRGNGFTSDALSDAGERIDYILLSTTANGGPSVVPLKARTLPMLDDQVPEGSLSDHKAVECVLEFRQLNHPTPSRRPAVVPP